MDLTGKVVTLASLKEGITVVLSNTVGVKKCAQIDHFRALELHTFILISSKWVKQVERGKGKNRHDKII